MLFCRLGLLHRVLGNIRPGFRLFCCHQCPTMHSPTSPSHYFPLIHTRRNYWLRSFAVSGTVTVHSCPHAKNISIRISEGAANEDLLSMMETKYTVKHKVLHLFSMGPSFDWFHCQMSHIEVLVPSSAVLNLTAQTISGIISVQARANFDRVDLGTSFGIIKSSHLHVENTLNIRAILGYVSLHEVKSNVTHVEIQTGVAHLHEFKGINTRVQIKVGLAHFNALESQKELFMEVDVGSICARDIVPAKTTHAVVEYGHLRFRPRADSCYAFLMETHYGQLNVIHFTDQHHHSKMGTLTAKKSGIVGTERAHSNIFVSSSYGHVTLVTEKPIVWNPEGHKVAEGHKTTTKSEVN